MLSLDPFLILLNNLSNELDRNNLQSLIHVCGKFIPAGQREQIQTGWDVFSILRHRNVIGEEGEKLTFLLKLIKELRPKRRDLVHMVKQYIEKHCGEQLQKIQDEVESSGGSYGLLTTNQSHLQTITANFGDDNAVTGCLVQCGSCFNCSCFPRCDGSICCASLAIFLALLTTVFAILWFIPSFRKAYMKRDPHLKEHVIVGVVLAAAFIAAYTGICGIYLRLKNRRRSQLRHSMDGSQRRNLAVYGSLGASSSCAASYHTNRTLALQRQQLIASNVSNSEPTNTLRSTKYCNQVARVCGSEKWRFFQQESIERGMVNKFEYYISADLISPQFKHNENLNRRN